jgi:two-component system, NarL family, sensor histidine kinase UhpB
MPMGYAGANRGYPLWRAARPPIYAWSGMRSRALFNQVVAVNAVLVCTAALAAAALAGLDFGETARVLLVIALAAGGTLLVNLVVLRRRFTPLERLIEEMEKVDLSRAGAGLPLSIDGKGETEEVERIELAFLRMMRRLEAERRRSSSAALQAQEEERARVARDLHDEVNQSLTGLLLRLEAARENAPPQLADELTETKVLANRAMQELLSLARQLRPTALDDLGLVAAIAGQVEEAGSRPELRASFRSEGDFGDLESDVQLVVYRVAQEALSNATRHSNAGQVEVELRRQDDSVELTVSDDGKGFAFAAAEGGLGLQGMRERALLVGGELGVTSRPGSGTTVRLQIPTG